MVRAEPRRYLGFAFVNPATDRGRIGAHGRRGPRLGCLRIKVHWRDGRITREVAEVARRRDAADPLRPGRRHRRVEMAARAYPDVAWIIPHLSSFSDDWKAQIAFVDQLVRLPNLFTDTSGVRYFDVLADAVRRAGPDKVLFGSDGPFLHPAVEIARSTPCTSPADAALVLGGNLLRLTRTARRGGRSRERRSS